MSVEIKKEIPLEIAHVLFVDLVGYSKLSINEQHAAVDELTQIVRAAEEFQKAEASERLIKIATGDGMALVFYSSPVAPVRCAMELSRALKAHPTLRVRMGIHSGPVSGVIDVSGRTNLTGAGINTAQRVMDCGDAGHILLSKHAAEDLAESDDWRPFLHDLGTCEVKHGIKLHLVNFNDAEAGRRAVPQKVQMQRRRSGLMQLAIGAVALAAIGAVAAGFILLSRDRTASTRAAPDKSIAVLPFENLSEEKQNAYFTDGVQDQILTALAKIADLKVISRTSVMQYKTDQPRNTREIGQQLGVAHLLEGTVQRAANKVRVNAQLIDARTDAHEWAENYDRPLDDVFAIQSEIAKAIAAQLQARLSPSEKSAIDRAPTVDVTAFDLYSRAKNLNLSVNFSTVAKPILLQAIDLLNQAITRDATFFLAQCQLAYAHDQLYFFSFDRTPERLALAENAIAAAFKLRPDAGEAHLAKAEHLYRGYLDYKGAQAELEIARGSLPNDAHVFELAGYIARRQGYQPEGLRNLERALVLDPRNFFTLQQIALSYLNLIRFSDATAALTRALAIKPDDVDTKVVRALVALDWKADTRPLHNTLEEIRTKQPEAITQVADYWVFCAFAERDIAAAEAALVALGDNYLGIDAVRLRRSFGEGLVARMKGDEFAARHAFTRARAEQEKLVQQQPNYGPAVCVLGLIDAALGRKEEALLEGRRAIELLPVETDSLNGAHMIQYFAMIAAWVGEKELALEQLEKAAQLHSYGPVTYGQLKLLPYWDSLRGDLRFEKIVASLAPK